MKRLISLLICCLLLLPAACGGDPPSQLRPESGPCRADGQAPAAESLPGEPDPEALTGEEDGGPYGWLVDFNGCGLPAAYREAVETYCRTGRFPDGQEPWATIPLAKV